MELQEILYFTTACLFFAAMLWDSRRSKKSA